MVAFMVVMMIICWNHKKIGSSKFYFILLVECLWSLPSTIIIVQSKLPNVFSFELMVTFVLVVVVTIHWFFFVIFWFHPNTMGRLTHHKKLIDFLFLNLKFFLEIFSCIEHIVRSSTPCNKLLHSFFQL